MKIRTLCVAPVGLGFFTFITTALGNPAPQAETWQGQHSVSTRVVDRGESHSLRMADELNFHETESGVEVFHSFQAWRTAFDGDGFLTRPVVQDRNGLAWSWGLALESFGFGAAQQSATDFACLDVEGNRVAYDWNSNLQEWYVFDSRGMEHGYTLQSRPTKVGSGRGPLVFDLRVRGTLSGVINQDRKGVRFMDANGVCVLTYSGLHVFDANGVSQPAIIQGGGAALSMVIDDSNAQYPLTIDPIAQSAYIKASNPDAFDSFGSVETWNDLLVVGAPNEDSLSGGLNGNELDNSGDDPGAAYIFSKSGGVWNQVAYLKAPMPGGPEFVRHFGLSVAVDQGRVAVSAYGGSGASQGGGAFVFENVGGLWTQTAYLPGSVGYFNRVYMSGDRILVGARYKDHFVYAYSGGAWNLEGVIPSSQATLNDAFAEDIDIDGDTIVVGAWTESSIQPESGAAYVFEWVGGAWTQTATLKASNPAYRDLFGRFVAVSNGRIGVGAEWEDSSTQGVNGNDGDNGRPDSGGVYIYEKVAGIWTQQSLLKAANAGQGDWFGWNLTMHGDRLAVAGHHEDSSSTGINGPSHLNDFTSAGAVYLFSNTGGVWSQDAYIKSNFVDSLFRAVDLALSDSMLMIGTYWDDSSSAGINGDPSDTGMTNSGAVLVYDLEAPFGNFCGTAVPNSSGNSASVTHSGSLLIADNALTLEVSGQPTGVFGYFISSQGSTVVPMAGGGQGTRCIGGGSPIGRHFASLQNSGAQGSMSYALDLTNFPGPSGPVVILSGETWHFQNWFRDNNPMPTSNFSNGLSIQLE